MKSVGVYISNILGGSVDGSQTFDGSTTILGMVPSANVYTMTRDIYCNTLTVNAGVTILNRGFRIFTTTLNVAATGLISSNGNNANGLNGGAIISASGVYQCAAGNGGNGRNTTGAGNNGGGSGGNNIGGSGSGAGGQADGGNLGGAGNISASPSANAGGFYHYIPWLFGRIPGATGNAILAMSGSGGGGGGGCNVGTGTASSGAGGSGGTNMAIFCKYLNNLGNITANGGNGSNATATGDGKAGGGGGGAGGNVAVFYGEALSLGTITANGGAFGTGIGGGANGQAGSAGLTIVQRLIF